MSQPRVWLVGHLFLQATQQLWKRSSRDLIGILGLESVLDRQFGRVPG